MQERGYVEPWMQRSLHPASRADTARSHEHGAKSLIPPDSTSTTLIEDLRRQSPGAWEMVTTLYGGLVYSWCRHAGVSDADAADVTQEVFRAVHRHLDRFRREGPEHSFRGWLWTITRNKLLDHHRRNVKYPEAIGGTDAQLHIQDLPDEHAWQTSDLSSWHSSGDSTMSRALEDVQTEFTARTWQAFWRSTVDEIPLATIAEELGTSVNAVRLAKSRVLRRLRERLSEGNN